MKVTPTVIPDVLLIEPDVYEDERGHFYESYNRSRFQDEAGIEVEFVQDNHSMSTGDVLRGLHYQVNQPQAKLVRVITGEIYDVAVDIRRSSPTFGRWASETLSAGNRKQLWIPEGFAHGFIVVSDTAEVVYKTSTYYSPGNERCIAWDDSTLGIYWPCSVPVLSPRDREGQNFELAEMFE